VLALHGEDLKKDSALAKACAKAGDVLLYEITKRDLPRWVQEQFARLGAKVTLDVCRRLVEIVGDDKLVLAREIDKLATWAGGEPLGVEEVEELAAPLGEGHPWDLTDAWGERDLARVLAVIEGEYRRSARPTQEPIAFAGRLNAHVTRLAKTKSMLEHGARTADVAAALGMKEFPARKLVAQAERFSIEELRAATVRIGRLDYALKGGSKLAPDLEVQLAVADVTREHR
jgi:DNA polymerase-3 subunit delta